MTLFLIRYWQCRSADAPWVRGMICWLCSDSNTSYWLGKGWATWTCCVSSFFSTHVMSWIYMSVQQCWNRGSLALSNGLSLSCTDQKLLLFSLKCFPSKDLTMMHFGLYSSQSSFCRECSLASFFWLNLSGTFVSELPLIVSQRSYREAGRWIYIYPGRMRNSCFLKFMKKESFWCFLMLLWRWYQARWAQFLSDMTSFGYKSLFKKKKKKKWEYGSSFWRVCINVLSSKVRLAVFRLCSGIFTKSQTPSNPALWEITLGIIPVVTMHLLFQSHCCKEVVYSNQIHSTTDMHKLSSTFKPRPKPPTSDTFAWDFTDQVLALNCYLWEAHKSNMQPSYCVLSASLPTFSTVSPLSEVSKLLTHSHPTTMLTGAHLHADNTITPGIIDTINSSLSSGTFNPHSKRPLLKKHNWMDAEPSIHQHLDLVSCS